MKKAVQFLIIKLRDLGISQPKPAMPEDLERAQAAGFPDELIEFYRRCEPDDCIELKQRIWSIDNAIIENIDAVPGCALFPHGFIVFASTLNGDSYCIDTNIKNPQGEHSVVLFSHEMIGEDMPLKQILSLRVEVASSLEEFLSKFADGILSEEPSYG